MTEQKRVQTDVLVIGGGIAGCFAAIRARELGAEVVLADKGYVGCSGQTPYAGSLLVFDGERHNREDWMNQFRSGGDYVTNLDWAGMMLDRSKECFEDMVSYGAKFFMREDGTYFEAKMPGSSSVALLPIESSLAPTLRKQVLKMGATIMDRSMVLDLVKTGERVTGAIGFTVNEAEPFVVEAKAVIIAAGAAGFKPPSWPIANLTADGDVMAYRAGAAITGKEFVDPHGTNVENPHFNGRSPIKRDESLPSHGGATGPGSPAFKPPVNAHGDTFGGPPGLNLAGVFEIHAGRGPIYMHGQETVSCAAFGMAAHKAEGIWPVGTDCGVGVDGLYAAGDSLGTMTSGSSYAGIGTALMGSAVTGKCSAETAVAQLIETAVPVDEDAIAAKFEKFYAPINRVGGHKPSWAIQLLQNIMMPYFVFMVKEEKRLNNALEQVCYLRDAVVPKLRAADAHELRLAIEAENMIINAEMKLRAAIARKESRGTHIREDYPAQNDAEFAGYIALHQQGGEMVSEFHPMPESWKKQPHEEFRNTFPL